MGQPSDDDQLFDLITRELDRSNDLQGKLLASLTVGDHKLATAISEEMDVIRKRIKKLMQGSIKQGDE